MMRHLVAIFSLGKSSLWRCYVRIVPKYKSCSEENMANRWKYMGHEIGVRSFTWNHSKTISFRRVGWQQILSRLKGSSFDSININGPVVDNMLVYLSITNNVLLSISTETRKTFMKYVTNENLSSITRPVFGRNLIISDDELWFEYSGLVHNMSRLPLYQPYKLIKVYGVAKV